MTKPAVNVVALSGCRFWSAKIRVRSCTEVSPEAPPGTPLAAQRARIAGSDGFRHGSLTLGNESAAPPYSSATLGARKAVPYVARTVTSRMGAYRRPSL